MRAAQTGGGAGLAANRSHDGLGCLKSFLAWRYERSTILLTVLIDLLRLLPGAATPAWGYSDGAVAPMSMGLGRVLGRLLKQIIWRR